MAERVSGRVSRRGLLGVGGAAVAGGVLGGLPVSGAQAAGDQASPAAADASAWSYVDRELLPHVVPPTFSDRQFPITDFGAVPGGTTKCTDAIRDAIEACTNAGGGHVLVPPGTWLTGAIHLRDNVDLHVSEGATLLFSTDPRDYLPVVLTRFEGEELMNYSPFVYADGCTNIGLTGTGTLDGQASYDSWWSWVSQTADDTAALHQMAADGVPVEQRVFGEGHHLRAAFVETHRCTNVLIDGLTVVRSPFWEIHPVLSRNVTVQNLHIDSRGPNNDGVDPESCRYVVIRGCTFDVGDDCIAIKSGKGADALRINVPCEDILVEGCTMEIRYGAIALGTEMTAGIRNVFVRDCTIGGPNQYYALYIKTNSVRGGYVENVFLRDLEVLDLRKEVVSCNLFHGEGDTGPYTPRVRNVELRDVHVRHARNTFSAVGYDRSPIEDLRVVNSRYDAIDAPSTITDTELTFSNLRVNGVRITSVEQLTG
jgi:polygalacturonase